MKKLLLILAMASVMTACKKEEEEPTKAANFIVTSQVWGVTSYNSPFITVTVKNNGTGTGYNLSVTYSAMSGNTIVDTGTAYPANLGDIGAGQSAVDDAIFFGITPAQANQYTYTYKTTWLNR